MDNEVNPTSYRLKDTTKARFKEIMGELDTTQQDTMEALIAAYDLQNNISTITDSKKQDLISNFRYHTSQMNQDFIAMVHWLQDADERAESKIQSLLKSKDLTIEDLQSQLKSVKSDLENANQQKAEALNKVKSVNHDNITLSDLNYQLKKQLQEAEFSHKNIVKDKSDLINILNNNIDDFKNKMEDLKKTNNELLDEINEIRSIKEECDKLKSEKANLEATNLLLIQKIEQLTENENNIISQAKEHEDTIVQDLKKQAKFELDQTLLKVKEQTQEQIQTIRENAQKKIDEYQLKYFTLLDQISKIQ